MAIERAALDAVLKMADKALGEFQVLLVILDRASLVRKLRDIADVFDKLPTLENDVTTLRNRLRGMMLSDPNRTPVTGISTEIAAVRVQTRGLTEPGGFSSPKVTPTPTIPLPERKPR